MIDDFGAIAYNTRNFRAIFAGSEGHVLEGAFSDGTIARRVKRKYASGFKFHEVCMLWIVKVLV